MRRGEAGLALGLGGGGLAAGVGLLLAERGLLFGAAARRGSRVALGGDVAALADGLGDDAASAGRWSGSRRRCRGPGTG